MKERPIIMGAESVRAILDGRKTQTRRVVKIPKEMKSARKDYIFWQDEEGKLHSLIGFPYGHIGDRLWVRETWQSFFQFSDSEPDEKAIYKADMKNGECSFYSLGIEIMTKPQGVWKSPMLMPRWASRITLEINDIRVEQLQDMRQRDAMAEGVMPIDKIVKGSDVIHPIGVIPKDSELVGHDYLGAYKNLWDSLNAKRGYQWESNPWVWVISFKRISVVD